MSLLKVAVLEDDQLFLKDLVDSLKRTKLVEVVVDAKDSDSFIKEVQSNEVDAVFLDIKLYNEQRNGIDVANILKKPTIFFTSARSEYTDRIEALKTSKDFPPVEEFNKSPDVERLKIILEKFIPRIRDFQKHSLVRIKVRGEEKLIDKGNVTFIVSSNKNHQIYFTNQDSIEIYDKSFEYFVVDLGFEESSFCRVGKSYLVNIEHAKIEGNDVVTTYFSNGKQRSEKIEIPKDKLSEIRKKNLKLA
ncbi:MAG: response regulator [Flavobacteriales bacterium]|nr:response regulator [Flavobacteriales bacterium]